MAYSSNSSTGSQPTDIQAASSTTSGNGTTSNSGGGLPGSGVGTSAARAAGVRGPGLTNGNFSGRLPGLGGGSWSSPVSETSAAHTSGVQGPGLANGNFGSSWSGNGNYGSGSGDYTYNNTSYSNNKSEPVMTVDEVYGKSTETVVIGNQPIVESQGDYNATSNEKSNVETSTFGKQNDITVTPESVTENKGLVDNSTIESIEGLNFQQKDKESQDVMEARKSRDDVEAEDKANRMRDLIKAKTEETLDEESAKQFQIGEKNTFEEQNNAKLNELNNLENDLSKVNKNLEEAKKAKIEADKKAKQAEWNYQEVLYRKNQADSEAKRLASRLEQLNDGPIANLLNNPTLEYMRDSVVNMAEDYGIDIGDISKANATELKAIARKVTNDMMAKFDQGLKAAENELTIAQKQQKDLEANQNTLMSKAKELESKYTKAGQDYKTWKSEYWANDTKTNAELSFESTKEAINNADLPEETKSKAIEAVNGVEASAKAVKEAADALAANPNDPAIIETYIKALKTYNENVKSALKGNPLAKTDLDKTFTEMVAKANDFDVIKPDGTKVDYAEFAAEMATKSPALAKGLYEAKAARLEEDRHPILAKLERLKASMVTTWFGSKFTFLDNQVRNQFIQVAKTDMRATYATYNNVLNNPNASPEDKAEAFKAINQANALSTASAALQASTGFLPGIGDSMSDGVYGTTDPKTLNDYQNTMNTISNLIKIVLGLGVTPGANVARQNMYYMAGAKVNESGLFSRDFDSDGFALCQEYGNSPAANMISGVGELATGVAMLFNPATAGIGLNLVIGSVQTFTDGFYGVQKDARKSQQYTQEILNYFKEAESIAAETGNTEVLDTISGAITQIENFELKADEVGNLDNWLEGSGSDTATNEKFNQSLTYDEWLKLIEADPTMRDYAKKLIAEKKEK